MAFTVRNYTDSDFNPYVEFYSRVFNRDPVNSEFYAEYLLQKFRRPGHSAHKDVFLAEERGVILGSADVTFESRIRRAVLNGYVLAGQRRRGIGKALLRRLLLRCRELGAASVHVNFKESNKEAPFFLARFGLSLIRSFYEMLINIKNCSAEPETAAGTELSHFASGEEDSLTQLQNRIFEGSWGFCPNSVEEIRYFLLLTGCRIENVICLKKENRNIGYSWFHPLPWRSEGSRMRIHMFGVDPEFQGKGYGRNLLLATLAEMRDKKATTTELTVDSKNTAAVALYESLGFTLMNRSLWYGKIF